jgi:hypothetical protein
MALEEFFKGNLQLKEVCLKATERVEAAFLDWSRNKKAESVKQANATLLDALICTDVSTIFQNWEKRKFRMQCSSQ